MHVRIEIVKRKCMCLYDRKDYRYDSKRYLRDDGISNYCSNGLQKYLSHLPIKAKYRCEIV